MCAVRIIYLPSVYLSISRLSISIYPLIQLYLSISRFMISIYLYLLYVSVYQSYIRSSQDSRLKSSIIYSILQDGHVVSCSLLDQDIWNKLFGKCTLYIHCTMYTELCTYQGRNTRNTLFTNIYSNLSDAVFFLSKNGCFPIKKKNTSCNHGYGCSCFIFLGTYNV